ncbi:MAG TPA: hypothetical protein VKX17_13265 [Planctomycetota bacterium]|nr:hypothetical protein [Planctomycetota bacterium]
MKSAFRMFSFSLCATALLLLNGCDDLDARNQASAASKDVSELRPEVDKVKKQNEELRDTVKALEERLTEKMNKRMDEIAASIADNQKKLLEQLAQDMKLSRDSSNNLAETARADNDKALQAQKADAAETAQKIRDEMKAMREELHGYMENQLKELYPYAFQPHRLEPNTPPGNSTPEKKESAPPTEQK